MRKKVEPTPLEIKMQDLHDYCKANNVPIFIASWQKETPENAGYIYEYLSPTCLGIDIKEQSGCTDKFPLFLRVVAGERTPEGGPLQ